MSTRLAAAIAGALITLTPITVFAQSVSTLNTQLQQAVATQDWRKAIQIVDKLIVAAPQQANQLRSYRTQLQSLITSSAPQRTVQRTRININPSPGYVKVAESKIGDQIYVRASKVSNVGRSKELRDAKLTANLPLTVLMD